MKSPKHLSKISIQRLLTCSPKLVELVMALDEDGHKIQVIEGARTLERQSYLISTGVSKIKNASDGKHVVTKDKPLSDAIDIAPLINGKIEWENTKAFYSFGEKVVAKAKELQIPLRWGGDWDGDGDYTDQTFNDLVHFELA